MAEDISNRALVVLLVLAIAVSLVGTMVSVGKLSDVGFGELTGRGIEGTVSINIDELLLINVTQTSVDFGTGYVVAPNSYCDLYSNDTSVPSCWTNVSTYSPNSFEVRNDGNVNVDFTAESGAYNTSNFLGGTGSQYEFATRDKETGSASTFVSWTGFNTSGQTAVQTMLPGNTTDEVYVDIHLRVADDSLNTSYTDTVTFTASES